MGLVDRLKANKFAKQAAAASSKDEKRILLAISQYIAGDCSHHEIMQWFCDRGISRARGQAMLDEAVK